jgi:hypothetical protein
VNCARVHKNVGQHCARWLRHCGKCRKVKFIGCFQFSFVLESTQSLTAMRVPGIFPTGFFQVSFVLESTQSLTAMRVPGIFPVGFFHFSFVLESTQSLTAMRVRGIFPGIKGDPHVRLTTLPPSASPVSYKIWYPRHLINLWATTACDPR